MRIIKRNWIWNSFEHFFTKQQKILLTFNYYTVIFLLYTVSFSRRPALDYSIPLSYVRVIDIGRRKKVIISMTCKMVRTLKVGEFSVIQSEECGTCIYWRQVAHAGSVTISIVKTAYKRWGSCDSHTGLYVSPSVKDGLKIRQVKIWCFFEIQDKQRFYGEECALLVCKWPSALFCMLELGNVVTRGPRAIHTMRQHVPYSSFTLNASLRSSIWRRT